MEATLTWLRGQQKWLHLVKLGNRASTHGGDGAEADGGLGRDISDLLVSELEAWDEPVVHEVVNLLGDLLVGKRGQVPTSRGICKASQK